MRVLWLLPLGCIELLLLRGLEKQASFTRITKGVLCCAEKTQENSPLKRTALAELFLLVLQTASCSKVSAKDHTLANCLRDLQGIRYCDQVT